MDKAEFTLEFEKPLRDLQQRLEALTSEYVDNASTEVNNSVDAGDGGEL